jgi:hypothetical protein
MQDRIVNAVTSCCALLGCVTDNLAQRLLYYATCKSNVYRTARFLTTDLPVAADQFLSMQFSGSAQVEKKHRDRLILFTKS